jgi:hypothetical protein
VKIARYIAFLLFLAALLGSFGTVLANGPSCTFNPDGSITCTTGGGGDDNGGGGGSNPTPVPTPVVCAPGETSIVFRQVYYPLGDGNCVLASGTYDMCSSSWITIEGFGDPVVCPLVDTPPPPRHPCTSFAVTSNGITCTATNGWQVVANVRFPETYLDVRPFPATLVRWPTAIRNGGQPSSSGSGTQAYYGTGSPGSPRVGDLSNIRLTLTLNPASPMYVTLPQIGMLTLTDAGATGTPQIIQWEVPSHPEAGGGPLSRTVDGMDELPGDLPLFVGSGRSAYRLYWNLSYLMYEAIEECVPGPSANGIYNCGGGTGHRAVTGYEWRRHSSGGEIPPLAVANLPLSIAADLNNDGVMDAYWNRNLTLRRMDDAGSVDNPSYRRSWNWGGAIYWAVREGQGQIGWPGGQ